MEIFLRDANKNDYDFIYQFTVEMCKTNFIVSYIKLESFDAFVKRDFSDNHIHYIIMNKNNEKIGHVHITKNNEIGYDVLSKYRNQGIGTEALEKIIELHPRERYFLTIHHENKPSIRLAEKNGFSPKGIIYEKVIQRTENID
jgi:RimJ/RimL family protein N-acetyltransferase